jgi:hypothetical protein
MIKWTITCPFCQLVYAVNYPHEMQKEMNCQCGARYENNFWQKNKGRFMGYWIQKEVK